jgi:hypothetical protein
MKTHLTTLILGTLMMASTAMANHKGDGKPCDMPNGKPCPMMLDKHGKPEHQHGMKHGEEPCTMKVGEPCRMMINGKPMQAGDLMPDGTPCPMKMEGAVHGAHAMPMGQHAMSGMNMEMQGDTSASSQAYYAGNMAMHAGMNVPFSGDADIDFLRGMIPHHQGAVDMARIQLKYGSHPQLKRMTREIIRAQELEIRQMTTLLRQLEANKAGYNDSNWLGKHKGDM